MNKSELKNFAINARLELLRRVADRANLYGVNADNCKSKAIVPSNQFQKLGGTMLNNIEIAQRNALLARIYENGYQQTMEEAAYTWFNRFIAIRYMQAHNRLPVSMNVFPDAAGVQPQMLREAQDVDLSSVDIQSVLDMLDENRTDELYKYLLIALCNELSHALPRMFETINDYTELLFPDGLLKADSVLGAMAGLSDDNWNDIQVIGWLYQYYISQRHDEVVDINGGAISKEDIPAATCLYTTDWVVHYMVENSLGRLWLEGHFNASLRMKWRYYMDEAEQTPDVAARLAEIRKAYTKLQPEQITVLDPCMGSGHILIYAFDVLMDIYHSVGYTDRDAVQSIIQNNLFGLDIDDRAAQLAYFAVMMKACDYDRRFLRRGIQPNLCGINESAKIADQRLNAFGDEAPLAQCLLNAFKDAKEFGSILPAPLSPQELHCLRARMDQMQQQAQQSLTGMADNAEAIAAIAPLMQQAEILARQYDAVITNPPYMNKFSANMKRYIQTNYADYKADIFAVFMHRNFDFCKENGYSAFMTPFVWMFIKSYEKLREEIIEQKCINTLIQMEYSAFEEATVPICTFVLHNSKLNYKGNYLRLSDFKGGMDVQNEKVLEAQNDPTCKYRHIAQQENFTKIPGHPIAYWVGSVAFEAYDNGRLMSTIGQSTKGIITGNNDRYMRLWWEVIERKINFAASNDDDAAKSKMKWFPCTKGGNYRKWYGNKEYIMNWENRGEEIINNAKLEKRHSQDYYNHLKFQKGISWSAITSGGTSFRYENKNLIEHVGMAIFAHDASMTCCLLGYLNSSVAEYYLAFLSPTITVNAGEIGRVPVLSCEDEDNDITVIKMVEECIDISTHDWDSFETSWDFKKHLLI